MWKRPQEELMTTGNLPVISRLKYQQNIQNQCSSVKGGRQSMSEIFGIKTGILFTEIWYLDRFWRLLKLLKEVKTVFYLDFSTVEALKWLNWFGGRIRTWLRPLKILLRYALGSCCTKNSWLRLLGTIFLLSLIVGVSALGAYLNRLRGEFYFFTQKTLRWLGPWVWRLRKLTIKTARKS